MHQDASGGVTFFMPWIEFGGVGASGYSLAKLGSYGNQAWLIPILAGATLLRMARHGC